MFKKILKIGFYGYGKWALTTLEELLKTRLSIRSSYIKIPRGR